MVAIWDGFVHEFCMAVGLGFLMALYTASMSGHNIEPPESNFANLAVFFIFIVFMMKLEYKVQRYSISGMGSDGLWTMLCINIAVFVATMFIPRFLGSIISNLPIPGVVTPYTSRWPGGMLFVSTWRATSCVSGLIDKYIPI